jgi:SAM-dependent methyltransferase
MPDLIPNRADVIQAYKTILGREPESEDVIGYHLQQPTDLFGLWQRLFQSDEYLRQQRDRLLASFINESTQSIEVETAKENIARLMQHTEQCWEKLGRAEPYWSVLSHDTFRMGNIEPHHIELFYKSGAAAVDDCIRTLERHGQAFDRSWTVLELGCGVGRVGEHFSKAMSRYIGVDVSAEHLAKAKAHFQDKALLNGRFSLLRDAIRDDSGFDLFYSLIVLQHNCPPMMAWLLDTFLQKLNVGGFVFFQLPCRLDGYNFDVEKYLEWTSHAGDHGIEMHALPQQYIFRIFIKHGIIPLEVIPYPLIGPSGDSYLFFGRKMA